MTKRLYALTDAQVAAAINCVDLDICTDDSLPKATVALYRRTITALESPVIRRPNIFDERRRRR